MNERFQQCEATYYFQGPWAIDENPIKHCVLAHGHDGSHSHPHGRWDYASETMQPFSWDAVGKSVPAIKPVAYISGPMSGLPDYNYPAFHEAASKLRADGYEVFNPAENFGGDSGLPRAEYMKLDLRAVMDADVVFVLPGWRKSKGAKLEVAIAKECGIEVKSI